MLEMSEIDVFTDMGYTRTGNAGFIADCDAGFDERNLAVPSTFPEMDRAGFV